ncbi:hypothetical protein PHMEG_0005024 [Phytophthora megakarya]|uniref:Uncharacterized protein n=1 Tax=Phytophthora megakarya TaxID=4795 RepID=A0A225WSG4_9STRA|nr:hypothetical protein PHMEG_0005024 [Phytophthora megakarya]
MPLNKACTYGSLMLLDRIWYNTIDLEPNGWGLWSVRKLLRTHKLYGKMQFTLCLLAAIKINSVEIVRWLFDRFPDYGVRRTVVYEAASAGALEILQYFRANGTTIEGELEWMDDEEGWDEEIENWERGRWVRWGGSDAANAGLAGHAEVVKWMYETSANEDRNDYMSIDSAFMTGNMELASWLIDRIGMEPEGHEALHRAAAHGHVESLQWFQDRGLYIRFDAGTLIKAAEAGYLNVVRWIIDRDWNDEMLGTQVGLDEYKNDYNHGERTRLTYLTCLGGEASLAIHAAAVNGHIEVAKYLHAHVDMPLDCDEEREENRRLKKRITALLPRFTQDHNVERVSGKTMAVAAQNGFLDVVKWLYREYQGDPTINLFWFKGYIDEDVNVDFDEEGENCSIADVAAANGHLEVLQYLLQVGTENEEAREHKRRRTQKISDFAIREKLRSLAEQHSNEPTKPACTEAAMNGAATHGHLDVVRWLHDNGLGSCTVDAMDFAAQNGHLETVKWLHANRLEGCSTAAMDGAASGGYLDIVKWLHEHRSEGCTAAAMDKAARGGHLNVIKWLHENRTEGCTVAAMDGAAAYGELDTVKWLHRNRSEGCRELAMNGAAHEGHLHVLRWLFENRNEGFTAQAIDNASRFAQFETVLVLHNIAQQGLVTEIEIMEADASETLISDRYHDIVHAEFYRGNAINWQ